MKNNFSVKQHNTRWWGWGEIEKTFDLSDRPFFWPFLNQLFPLPPRPVLEAPPLEAFHLPPSRIPKNQLDLLKRHAPQIEIVQDSQTRIRNAVGKSYRDLIRIRLQAISHFPDAVLYPQEEAEIYAVLQWANELGVAVVPRGGGTSVVGGVEAVGKGDQPVVVLNLLKMNRIIKLWPESHLVDVQAGVLGPHLENVLNQHGFTLGHFPESFHYSTVGGWVATRSAGQQSTFYGKIEDMVEKICLITPTGQFCTPSFPAAADGPDVNRLLAGSEGRLGVITRIRLRMNRFPQEKQYLAVLFPSFAAGAQFIQFMIQQGLKPATVRLSDELESDFFFALRQVRSGATGWLQERLLTFLERRGYQPGKRAIMIVGFEGARSLVRNQLTTFRKMIQQTHHQWLGKRVGQTWYNNRFRNPYLRDVLMDYGLLVDTLETATSWHNWEHLYRQVKMSIQQTYQELGIPGVVMAHISHVYPTGTSLYFILLAQVSPEDALSHWEKLKTVASRTIVEHMGTIGHHHGVGLDHKPWIRRELDPHILHAWKTLQQLWDPRGILNPGKLFPDETQ